MSNGNVTSQDIYLAGGVSMFLQRYCGNELEFLGCHNFTGGSVPKGDLNPLFCRIGRNSFSVKRKWRGAPGLGTMTAQVRAQVVDYLGEIPCPYNLYAMFSECGADEDPTQWDFIWYFDETEPTEETFEKLSIGIDPSEQGEVLLGYPLNFNWKRKIKRLFGQQYNFGLTQDVNAVASCDAVQCSNVCGTQSAGCQGLYYVTNGAGGDPAVVIKTTTGGSAYTSIATPFTDTTHPIRRVVCDGDTVIVTNGVATQYAYSWDALASWAAVVTTPRLINDAFMLGATRCWFACQGGYILFTGNRGQSFEVLSAGTATTQSLNAISFADALRGYAAGDQNTFMYTRDGRSFALGTGPTEAAGWDLYSVRAVPDTDIVFVGDELGNVYRSMNYGQDWTRIFVATTKTAGGIAKIMAKHCNFVSFIANDQDPYWYSGSPVDGSFFRSIDGGGSWYEIKVPANNGLNYGFECDPNQYWITGEDGFVAKVAGAQP